MTSGQFHLEADLAERIVTRRQMIGRSDAAIDTGLASLVIGLGTRGSLVDSEKEFLDSLVPPHSLCFLVFDSRYLHPEGLELLSADQLEASYLQGDAIYSHRQRPVSGRLNACRVYASRGGEVSGRQVTLGMIGPDSAELFDSGIDRFTMLAQQFRQAVARVSPLMGTLRETLDRDHPVLIVNRCSGRVVAANAALLEKYAGNSEALIDSEYGESKSHLSELISGYTIAAKNVHTDELDLALLVFTPKPVKAEELAHGMYGRFVGSLRRSTQALHATAHHLEGIINWQPGHPEAELLHLIHEETADLEQIVQRYQVLAEFDQLRKTDINPAEELRNAVTRAAIAHPKRQLALTEQWESATSMRAPSEALVSLYDTILQIHLGTTCSCTTTTVQFRSGSDRKTVVRFTTTENVSGGHPHLMADWVEYIAALGRLLGFAVQHRAGDSSTIETILTQTKDTTGHE
ncbi:MAG: hypothetical protein NDJ18_06640 [candidate division Zixibacteria bacterium]|nr:hypothetical protein [candidate division Zixibacteria bacterium]